MNNQKKQLCIDFELSSYDETSGYLDDSRNGFYALCTKAIEGKWQSKMMPLHTLPYVLEQQTKAFEQYKQLTGKRDVYISQASFTGWTNKHGQTVSFRRKVSLASIGTLFVDFDYYKDEKLKNLTPEQISELILKRCYENKIPMPSVIIDSGRGVQAKWHHCQLPRKALPRWDACEVHLVNMFKDLSSDNSVKDSTRVLRLTHTINQKSGQIVRPVFTNLDVNYTFNELCEAILPYTAEEVAEFKKNASKLNSTQKSAVVNFQCAKGHSTRSLNWHRLVDLQNLHKMRNLDMGDGLREIMAFYQANFYALTHLNLHADPNQYQELLRVIKDTHPNLEHSKATEKAGRLNRLMKDTAKGVKHTYNGTEYIPLYTPRNDTLINQFEITSEEQKHLSTIIDKTEKQKRNTEAKRASRQHENSLTREEYLAQSNTKAALAIKLKNQGLSQRAIAQAMGVSVGSVNKYLRSVQCMSL